MGKRRQAAPRNREPLRWEFPPDIPTHDSLDGLSLEDPADLQEAVENFIFWLEDGSFATWEAVVCQEQGRSLTVEQKKLLGGLLNFGAPDDDQVLYIDEIPRPTEPWYVILNQIVPHLLVEPLITSDIHDDVQLDGWNRLMRALREHGQGLSLPAGASSVEEVVPPDLRHRLWLQDTVVLLDGLGQEPTLNLADQPWRIDEFIQNLRDRKESVEYLGLTLNSLLSHVVLPESERPLFLQMMKSRLGLTDDDERIADRL